MPKKITSVVWDAWGQIPNGVKFNTSNGTFSGTPTEIGEYNIAVSCETNYGYAEEEVIMNVSYPGWKAIAIETTPRTYRTHISRMAFLSINTIDSSKKNFLWPVEYYASNKFYDIEVYRLYSDNPSSISAINDNTAELYTILRSSTGFRDMCYDRNLGIFYPVTDSIYYAAKDLSYFNCFYYNNGNSVSKYICKEGSVEFNAICYSDKLKSTLLVTNGGMAGIIGDPRSGGTFWVPNFIKTGLTNISRGGVKWSDYNESFCLIGASGTAISLDGETWTTYSSVPSNLQQLKYDESLNAFTAWSSSDKKFYYSYSGGTWFAKGSSIPLDKINGVAHDEDLDIYCAIGVKKVGGYNRPHALFTRNFVDWIETIIVNTSDTPVDVIYIPTAKCFVCTVKSQYYFYTYNPSVLKL